MRQYKVVIVDDEPVIVEGLRRTVNWDAYHCVVVGTAASGAEGKHLVEKLHPDLLFTDIRMPGLSGLGMLAALKSEHADMEITILTGYREFEYAQEAIRLGVRRFLVKPSKMAEINEAVEAMIHEIDARHAEEAGSQASSKQDPSEGEPEKCIAETTADNATSFVVRSALSYMEEHYKEKLTLQSVADHVYVSSWHLSKLLNNEGGSFSDTLNGIRIRHAKQLMKDPSLRISDIAEEVGFLDLAHFSRIFRKVTDMSPNEYRNHRRE